MKVTFVSDTHLMDLEDLVIPKSDVLIHSGDIDAREFKDIIKFIKWFKIQPVKHKIFVAGNHDFFFEKNYDTIAQYFDENECIYLENSAVKVCGKYIYGSPFTPTFGYWAFMKDRGRKIRKVWDLIPDYVDILVTHGPPMGFFDRVKDGSSVGCTDLLQKVLEIRPTVHAFGHLHNNDNYKNHGVLEHEGITFVNSSVMDDWYDPVNKPITLDI